MPSIAENAAAYAETRVGERYVYGAAGLDATDCSGLVKIAFAHASHGDIELPHNTVEQRRQVPRIGGERNLRVGDLCFSYGDRLFRDRWGGLFGNPTHVGIYIGHGYVVQATNEARGVERIHMNAYTVPTSFGRVKRAQKEAS